MNWLADISRNVSRYFYFNITVSAGRMAVLSQIVINVVAENKNVNMKD